MDNIFYSMGYNALLTVLLFLDISTESNNMIT